MNGQQSRVQEIKSEIARRQAYIAEHRMKMTCREIAAALGMTHAAVRSEARRQRLREQESDLG